MVTLCKLKKKNTEIVLQKSKQKVLKMKREKTVGYQFTTRKKIRASFNILTYNIK